MINEKYAKQYCCEDISLIEGYAEAIADSKLWDCHHRAETDEKLTHKELKAQGRYWNRPASELIFLTRAFHTKLHFDAGTYENQRKAAVENNVKLKSKKVLQLTLNGTFVQIWPSLNEIKRQTRFHEGYICDCCNGKHKSAYGYIWRYFSASPGDHN